MNFGCEVIIFHQLMDYFALFFPLLDNKDEAPTNISVLQVHGGDPHAAARGHHPPREGGRGGAQPPAEQTHLCRLLRPAHQVMDGL